MIKLHRIHRNFPVVLGLICSLCTLELNAQGMRENLTVFSSQSDTLSCGQLYEEGLLLASPDKEYYAAGDTLKYYVEHCYSYAGFNTKVFGNIADDFFASGPGGYYPGDGDTLPNLLQWFFNVLYLDTDTQYYCYDASAALECQQAMYVHDSSFHTNPMNGASGWAAVEKYLLESGKCQFLQSQIENSLGALYVSWYRVWKDSVTDSLLTPWDTTNLPTLQQIGFEALLGSPAAVQGGIIPTSVLGNIGVAPNPFTDNTVIDYTLNVPATLTVEVFNVLGQKVASPVPSVFTINGNYSLTLTGSALASGAYYVRFAVPEGEVETVKIVKN
jgi:Secretion system C-terminal sorting domain